MSRFVGSPSHRLEVYDKDGQKVGYIDQASDALFLDLLTLLSGRRR